MAIGSLGGAGFEVLDTDFPGELLTAWKATAPAVKASYIPSSVPVKNFDAEAAASGVASISDRVRSLHFSAFKVSLQYKF